MIAAYLKRGLAAGLLAGLLAGLVGLVIGEPSVDAAVAIEEATAAGQPPAAAAEPEISRPLQKMGLVAGTGLIGLALGGIFGVLMAWATGRLSGDGWTRSLKVGAVLLAAVVVFPALKYPPNPPTVGDPDTIATRTTLYLGLCALGLLLASASYAGALRLRQTALSTPVRQLVVGAGTVAAGAVILAVLPALEGEVMVPATLLWSFRLGSIAIQTVLCLGTAVVFGLLAVRAEQERTPDRARTVT